MATDYKVLKAYSPGDISALDGGLWDEIDGTLKASSATQAIQLAATEHGEGSYVAVPARSFKVLKATAVSRPSFKVSG